MATKKKIITTTVTDGEGNDNNPEPNELDSIGSYIAEITNSADDTMVSLFKYDRGGGKPVWLRDLMKEEFSLEDIRAGWGAGTYQARATNNGKLKRAITFRIGPDREDEQVSANEDESTPVKNAFESQLQMLQLQSNQMFRIVLEMIRANGANGNKSDLAGVVGVVKDLQSLAPPSNRAQLISEIKEVLEIGEMIGGGGTSGKASDPWTALTSILSQKLLKAEDGAAKAEAPAIPAANPAAALPTGLPVVPVPAAEPPTLLQLLVDKAIRGKDPELWAHMVLEWASDEARSALEMVGAILAASDAQTWIATQKVADGLKPWFTDFFAAIRASYEAESPAEAS